MPATLEVTDCTKNTATAAPSTGITITKPTNLADGDVLYAVLCKNSYAVSATFTCSGWTEVTSGTRGTTTGNDRHTVVLRKVITNAAGEAASYTFVTTDTTSRNMAGLILRVSGADTTTPEDAAVPSIAHTSNDATPASRDVTTATADALVIQVHVLSMNSGTAAKTWGAPSGYSTNATYLQVTNTDGTLELQVGVAYKTQASPGAVGTNAWTHTADDATSESATTVVAVRSKVSRPAALMFRRARLQAASRAAAW